MITLYSSHCPKCRMLALIMDEKRIGYEVVDDEKVYLPLADQYGIKSMPFAMINGEVYNTKDLQTWINTH